MGCGGLRVRPWGILKTDRATIFMFKNCLKECVTVLVASRPAAQAAQQANVGRQRKG